MAEVWDEARIQQLIDDDVQEDVHLDYKSKGSLGKQNDKRDEITKDVSAMANSDGGHVIYGVHEKNDIPSHITPVDSQQFSKGWLEQVIGNIRPTIEGVCVHRVALNGSSSGTVYVVEVPKSDTLHQAADKKYYKRSTSHSVPMEHFEILDVLNRQQHPRIELRFTIAVKTITVTSLKPQQALAFSAQNPQRVTRKTKECELRIDLVNTGRVFARFVEAIIELPNHMLHSSELPRRGNKSVHHDPGSLVSFKRRNTRRDVIGVSGSGTYRYPNYGPARYVPVFPDQNMAVDEVRLLDDFSITMLKNCPVSWTTYADNAMPRYGEVAVKDIQIMKETDSRFEQ